MTDAAAKALLARMLLHAAAAGDRRLLALLAPAAAGDAKALARFKAAAARSARRPGRPPA